MCACTYTSVCLSVLCLLKPATNLLIFASSTSLLCRQQLPFEYPHPLTPPQAPPPSGPQAIQVSLSYEGATLRTENIVCTQAGCHVFASESLALSEHDLTPCNVITFQM